MELSFAMCETIVKTLPIGYYTSRRIDITVSKDEPTSYYDMMNDKIVVSYPIIAERCAKISKDTNEEEAVRSMLYHEVSHAILTPTTLESDTAVNIFEDERIETLLQDYYMNVNFKQQLNDLVGGSVPTPDTPEQAFFNAVRLGIGPKKFQKRIEDLIEEYQDMNRGSSTNRAYSYKWDIHRLYEELAKDFKKNPESYSSGDSDKNGSDGSSAQSQNNDIKQGQGNGQEQNSGSASSMETSENSDGESSDDTHNGEHESSKTAPNGMNSHNRPNGYSREQLEKMVAEALSNHAGMDEQLTAELNDFQKKAEVIIGNFHKKNNGGSGINAYSGVFNPRAVVRKDYRYFDKPVTTQGNNKFGTCHLNLIIDCSGSFYRNAPLVNGILAVLSELERKNRNFSMDVAFINDQFRMCNNVKERWFEAQGGNTIPKDMRDILVKMQKPNTCNYTIVLFDGDALSDSYGMTDAERNARFHTFDRKQLTLITDEDNKRYMRKAFTSAKVVVTQDYTDELVKHILQTLTVAFG